MTEGLKQQDLTDNEKINRVLNRIYRHQLRYDRKASKLKTYFDLITNRKSY